MSLPSNTPPENKVKVTWRTTITFLTLYICFLSRLFVGDVLFHHFCPVFRLPTWRRCPSIAGTEFSSACLDRRSKVEKNSDHCTSGFTLCFSFFQLENLSCPLMFIVGEDDLSSASLENADLVVCSRCFLWCLTHEGTIHSECFCVLLVRLRRTWGLLGKLICWPVCLILVLGTWSSRLTLRTEDHPCGASNPENVSRRLSRRSHFRSHRVCFVLNGDYFMEGGNNPDLSCSGHTLGRSSRTSCCCPGGFLEEDAGLYGASSETLSGKQTLVLHISEISDSFFYLYLWFWSFSFERQTLLNTSA